MTAITLTNPKLRLVVDPAKGMNLYAFSVFQRNAWLDVMPDTTGDDADLNESSFVMVPYSNRIEDGRFAFDGKAYQLDNGERHAIHGDVRLRAWVVEESNDQRLHASFDSRRHENVNWPWAFAATLEYALEDNVLASRMTLQNLGDSAMPAGFGWHPYYNRRLTRQDEPVQLRFNVAGVYPDANNNRIPSGPGQPLAPHQDFQTEKALAPNVFLDMCCYGYDGKGTITWPESGVKLIYRCSAQCTHLVMYNPAKPYFAVEPVTNANNGVNLLADGDPTSGVQVLQPGETLQASFDVVVELD